jgi:predicted regulator of Ras-like GTPase activity (Roadblock/LC7/MglB family)
MGKTSFEQALDGINRQGSFLASVLASSDGLPIATVPSDYDTDVTAAMVALLRSVASQAQDHVGMSQLDEVTVRAGDHIRLVCRCFQLDGQDFILAVVVPGSQRYYRQLTNQAIKQLTEAWRTMVQD